MKIFEKTASPDFLVKRLSQYKALLKQETEGLPQGMTKNKNPRIVKLRRRIKALQSRVTSTLNK